MQGQRPNPAKGWQKWRHPSSRAWLACWDPQTVLGSVDGAHHCNICIGSGRLLVWKPMGDRCENVHAGPKLSTVRSNVQLQFIEKKHSGHKTRIFWHSKNTLLEIHVVSSKVPSQQWGLPVSSERLHGFWPLFIRRWKSTRCPQRPTSVSFCKSLSENRRM